MASFTCSVLASQQAEGGSLAGCFYDADVQGNPSGRAGPSTPDPMFLPVLLQHCPALQVFMV